MSISPPQIFRAYDIRGIASGVNAELTENLARALGFAYTTWIEIKIQKKNGVQIRLVVGRDNRDSGEKFAHALIEGMVSAGASVDYLDYATSPYLYFSVCHGKYDGGINVTGSHNPPEYNGFKLTREMAIPIAGEEIQEIRELIEEGIKNKATSGHFVAGKNKASEEPTNSRANEITNSRLARTCARIPKGSLRDSETPNTKYQIPNTVSYKKEYLAKISTLAPRGRKLKLVLDAGNGTAGYFTPELFRALGYDVTELYCDPDPKFPHHLPNPEEAETLHDLQKKVLEVGADLGLAWDGDGDRVGVVDERGVVVAPDQLIILLARDLLTRKPGAEIIFDVKCSNLLPAEILKAGGKPTRWKTGHSFVKQKMRETGALLAGEVSGHIFFAENYYGVDDGILAAAHIASIVSRGEQKLSEYFSALPHLFTTPDLKLPIADTEKFTVMEKIVADFQKEFTCDTLDGVRIDFDAHSWGLIRASNTSPYLTLRIESDDSTKLARYQTTVAQLLNAYPELDTSSLRA